MRPIHFLILPVIAASLSGCVVREDRDYYGHGRAYYYDGDDNDYYDRHDRRRDRNDHGYYHCPPGHAKKGWC